MRRRISTCIIDDDNIYLLGIQRIIAMHQLCDEVTVFRNGEEALRFFKTEQHNDAVLPDVVLLDINMPIMDGWQFLDEFKQFYSELAKRIQVYLVSSSIDPYDLEKAKEYQELSGYVTKPINAEGLRALLTDGNTAYANIF